MKCEERIGAELKRTLKDLRAIIGDEFDSDALDELYEYGLAFDFVAPNTFSDQREGYFRWQLSTGGDYNWPVYRVEYWFLDWYDGAHRVLGGEDEKLLIELFEVMYTDIGETEHQYNKAIEDY